MYCVVCTEYAFGEDFPKVILHADQRDYSGEGETEKGICADCMNIYLRVLKAMIERSTL